MNTWTLIIDNGDTEERTEFATREEAAIAWRAADKLVDSKEIYSAQVKNPAGKQVLWSEAAASDDNSAEERFCRSSYDR